MRKCKPKDAQFLKKMDWKEMSIELVEQGQREQPHLAEFVHWIAPQKGDFLFRPKPDPKY